MIETIPKTIDLSQGYLADYWARQFGVSRGRLEQALSVTGNDTRNVKKYLDDGYRIAIRDANGVGHQVVRITLQHDGFGVLVPYHPAKSGWIYELPLDYSQRESAVPLSVGKHYTVTDVVKLSIHMNGFVQFSGGGGKPIVSGYNPDLDLIKGAGLRAPDPVRVTTGPLFGVIAYQIENFDRCTSMPVEMFEVQDLWYRAGETTENDTAFNIESFMLPSKLLSDAREVGGKRLLRRKLPYKSQIWFEHDLRVVELPHLPFFLGVIVSRFRADSTLSSGYKIGGPGCGGPGHVKKSLGATYPCPDFVSSLNPVSLDYMASEPREDRSAE